MGEKHKSSSEEQMIAEQYIFKAVEKRLQMNLEHDSKIYLAGDYKQSLLSKTINNPLIKMCNEFKGNEKFGCIYLGEDVRSETSKLFADLFEKDHF